ncbi:MAG: exonuclease [Candidatus Schekmanbacteria bacterium]|nr:MAG: exonuclease [Candidatus Schekmanbacteria bacterium]
MPKKAYLDIETTGLNPANSELTVIGIMIEDDEEQEIIQLFGKDITAEELLDYLNGVDTLYTYNGKRFDLPFIKAKLGIDLEKIFRHKDLMYSCWKNNLYGGLKVVERNLGIGRTITDVDGYKAVQLWRNYERYGSYESLEKLLEYNKEDVLNLKVLREMLGV